MAKRDIYERYAIGDAQERQMRGFIGRTSRVSYQAALRQALIDFGYDDRAITVTNADALRGIDSFAAETANRSRRFYNTLLERAIKGLPQVGDLDDLADTDAANALAGFFAKVRDHNLKVWTPFVAAQARAMGRADFVTKTRTADGARTLSAATTWTWTQNTDFPDDCTEAQTASPASYDDLVDIGGGEPPVHNNCQCELAPNAIDPAILPPDGPLVYQGA